MSETNEVVVSTVLAGAAAWAFRDLHNYFYATMTFILHFFYGITEACSICKFIFLNSVVSETINLLRNIDLKIN